MKNWQDYHNSRLWGSFFNLFEEEDVKVKELIVKPNEGMSFQRHFKRHESWLISAGKCEVNFSKSAPSKIEKIVLEQGDRFYVPVRQWHQITNPFNEECRIIEIQFGEETDDSDIERLYYFKD